MTCTTCGATNSEHAGKCFACGAEMNSTEVAAKVPAQPATILLQQKTSSLAVVSLILGVVGMVGMCCIPVVFSIAAIICGHIACSQINREPAALSGKGMAITGLILGYIGVVAGILYCLLFGFAFILSVLQESSKNH